MNSNDRIPLRRPLKKDIKPLMKAFEKRWNPQGAFEKIEKGGETLQDTVKREWEASWSIRNKWASM